MINLKSYIRIARPDHWAKNVFMLPGTLIAAMIVRPSWDLLLINLILGVTAACLIASANYTINEWLDRDYDRFHPVKKARPSVAGNIEGKYVWVQYILLAITGMLISIAISPAFAATNFFLLVMGVIYNVKPLRSKDKPYVDVLSESINNPIRLCLGWFLVTTHPVPPSSLLCGYWFGGAFLMGVKRFAEYRFINNPERAGLYRRSFRHYTEQNLLLSCFFYALCAGFFMGTFLVKYRIELVITFPFLAFLFTWYLMMGFKPNSPTQHPEDLYHEGKFLTYTTFLAALFCFLIIYDLPFLHDLIRATFKY